MNAVSGSSEHAVPTIANKYVPLFELGQGGMGTVVLAVVRGPGGFNKLQVVKALRPELAENPEFLTMFLDEARLSARINHANVVQTNEVGFDGASYFLAMEYLEGQSLEAFFLRTMKVKKTLDLHVFVRIVVDACAGLHHAHELTDFDGRALNVVHRDVSPHNIFITYDGQTKVLDFGIAKAADSSSQTRTGIIKGKVAYMAPEQFKSGAVDRRADVFALGAILWRVIAGRRLWKEMTDVEVYQHLADGKIPSPTALNPNAPADLVEICMKALSPNPADRYQSAADLQVALEDWLDRQDGKASPRQIGKMISELFADRRASVKGAIEARLAAGIPTSQSVIAVPQLYETSRDPESFPDVGASLSPGPRAAPGTGAYTPTPASQIAPLAPSRSRPILLLVAAGLSVLAAGVIIFRLRAESPRNPEVGTPVGTAGGLTALTVETDPTEARVRLDDAPIEHRSVVKKDGSVRKLTVEMPGYVPRVQMVTMSSPSIDLHVALDPEVASSAPAPAATAPDGNAKRPIAGRPPALPSKPSAKPPSGAGKPEVATSPAPTPAPAPTPPTPGQGEKGLDKDDPWGNKK